MSWGLTAIGVGIAGQAIAANGAKTSANKAADANAKNAADTNAANLKLFNLSRGGVGDDGYGHSILPTYFGGNEQQMGQQAYDTYNQLLGAGQSGYNNLQGYQSQLSGAVNSGIGALANRYNGQDLAQRIGYSDPYYQARLNQANTYGQGYRDVAAANNSGIDTGLMQAMAQMNASRQRQGYFGNSTFDRNQALSATLGARQQAAVGTAQANAGANNLQQDALLANAGDLRGLQMTDLENRSNVGALGSAMSGLAAYQGAPASYLSSMFTQAQQPLNFFRISPQAFQQQNMPTVSPGINNQQIFGTALGQAGSGMANYSFYNTLAKNYGQQNQPMKTNANGTTTGMSSAEGYFG